MFEKGQKKFKTRGVQTEIPSRTQRCLWEMIKTAKKETELDYLQVFNLETVSKNGTLKQKITHSQEIPEYENTVLLSSKKENLINEKIFVIDSEEYSTMMLADEY